MELEERGGSRREGRKDGVIAIKREDRGKIIEEE
jgi:hypothetical protein